MNNFIYNPKSLVADEFISHQEILDTLDYAEKNKNNLVLINSILNKARERKGLTHREASVLLSCDIEEKNKEIFELAKESEAFQRAIADKTVIKTIYVQDRLLNVVAK